MSSPSFIKTMIEALRTKPSAERRVYKDGQVYRTEPIPSSPEGMELARRKMQYGRYVTMQHQMGESPVSYEDWVGSQ